MINRDYRSHLVLGPMGILAPHSSSNLNNWVALDRYGSPVAFAAAEVHRHNRKMSRIRTIAILAAAAVILLLSGCVRFQAQLTVTQDNVLHGEVVVASIIGDGDQAVEDAKERAAEIEEKLLPDLSGVDGVTRSEYNRDGYAGSSFTLENTPLQAINSDSDRGSLHLKRDGETFVFDGVINFSPDSDEAPPKDADESNIEVAITFPGAVTEHNGKLNGTEVSWNTSYEGSLDMHAVASAEPTGPATWVWVVSGIAGLVVLVAVIIAVGLMRRRTN